MESLGGGKKPLVTVTLNNYTYRSAIAKMGDNYLISLSADHRKATGVAGGDSIEVTLAMDTAPRTVEVPPALQAAFDGNTAAKAAFDKLAPSKKKAMALSIEEAKTDDTRQRRIEKAIQSLS